MPKRRYDDNVNFHWTDDECAGITCHCGEEMTISTHYPAECPNCTRIYQLYQVTRVVRRTAKSCNFCPHCGAIRYDDGSYCPGCTRDDEGKTREERYEMFERYLAEKAAREVST